MKKCKKVYTSVDVSMTNVDEAIEKVTQLSEELRKAKSLASDLASLVSEIDLKINI